MKPGIDGQEFRIVLDRNMFNIGDSMHISTGDFIVTKVHSRTWWKTLLRIIGFNIPYYSIKLIPRFYETEDSINNDKGRDPY